MDSTSNSLCRCKDIGKKFFVAIRGDAVYCKAKEENRLDDCPKARLRGDITPVCWKVKKV